MTEDEAFIRAVVASPGDDTPRLVYADWLDDHDNPRVPYLRAEVECAKPWRSGERPADSAELRALASGLDPVWVARVSRPPLGVCCDHVRFEQSGPQLSETDLAEVNRWPRVRFPEKYTAFLLNYNGGTPRVGAALFGQLSKFEVILGRFFSFHPKGYLLRDPGTLHREVHRYWNDQLPQFLESTPPEFDAETVMWYHEFIPIGVADNERAALMLGVHGEDFGRVLLYYWAWGPGPFLYEESNRLGKSFAGMLAQIVPWPAG